MGKLFYLYNMSNYGRRAFCFAGPYVWNSLPEHIRQSAFSINSCLQALTKTISTPADIAPSGLETIVFYCFMGYISALTYYLCISNSMIPGKQFTLLVSCLSPNMSVLLLAPVHLLYMHCVSFVAMV